MKKKLSIKPGEVHLECRPDSHATISFDVGLGHTQLFRQLFAAAVFQNKIKRAGFEPTPEENFVQRRID